MIRKENQMSHIEIDLIKNKVIKSKIFISFFLFFIIGWFIIWFQIDFSLLTNVLGIILTLFILILIVIVYKKSIDTKKDLEKKIKISDNLKIINKYTERTGRSYNYLIILESNEIKKYQLKQDVYKKIQINDIINIEYSKFARWILKIEHNGENIANKDIIS